VPVTEKPYFMRLAAETVAPKLVIVAEHVVLQEPMVAVPLPSEAFAELTSATESVSPEHAVGIPPTFTCVTFPELLTFRVAVSEETPHDVTAAFPADRLVEPIARVAAAAHAANVAATVTANPSVLERVFMSGFLFRLPRTGAPAARCPVRIVGRRGDRP
jgi:hypothetical protein